MTPLCPLPLICPRCLNPKSMFGVNLNGVCWECLRWLRDRRCREPVEREVGEVLAYLPSFRKAVNR